MIPIWFYNRFNNTNFSGDGSSLNNTTDSYNKPVPATFGTVIPLDGTITRIWAFTDTLNDPTAGIDIVVFVDGVEQGRFEAVGLGPLVSAVLAIPITEGQVVRLETDLGPLDTFLYNYGIDFTPTSNGKTIFTAATTFNIKAASPEVADVIYFPIGTFFDTVNPPGTKTDTQDVVARIPFPCTVNKMYVQVTAGTGGPTHPAVSVTLRKTSVDTGLTIPLVADAQGIFSATLDVHFAAGDMISFKVDEPNTKTNKRQFLSVSCAVTSDDGANHSILHSTSNKSGPVGGGGATKYYVILGSTNEAIGAFNKPQGSVATFIGKLKQLWIKASSDVGGTWTVLVRKNDIDTALTVSQATHVADIADAVWVGNITDIVDMGIGDYFQIVISYVGPNLAGGSFDVQNVILVMEGPTIDLSTSLCKTGSSTILLDTADYGSFSGDIDLSISGLPFGLTASFNPNPTTALATLLLTAVDVAVGVYELTITLDDGATSVDIILEATIIDCSSGGGGVLPGGKMVLSRIDLYGKSQWPMRPA